MSEMQSLFPEAPEEIRVRVDSEIATLLLGISGGPLGIPINSDARRVLGAIRYHRGRANAIRIDTIRVKTDLGDRAIKKAVRDLRLTYRLPIGSSKRADGGGYYLMLTPEDRAAWMKDVLDQVRAEVEVLASAAGQQAALEMLDQLRIAAQAE